MAFVPSRVSHGRQVQGDRLDKEWCRTSFKSTKLQHCVTLPGLASPGPHSETSPEVGPECLVAGVFPWALLGSSPKKLCGIPLLWAHHLQESSKGGPAMWFE